MMKQKFTLWAATIALALFALPSLAQADLVLNVDLTVADQVTISALPGVSAGTVSGSDTKGFYLGDFYTGDPGATTLSDTSLGGDLIPSLDTSNGGSFLFNSNFTPGGAGSNGLNVFSYTDNASSEFEAGILAFSGSETWTLDAESYAQMLAGAADGSVWAFADTDDDIADATLIGEYVVKRPGGAIPEPTSLVVLGLGSVALAFRRRRA